MTMILCSSCVPGAQCTLGRVVEVCNWEVPLRNAVLRSHAPGPQCSLGHVAELCTQEVQLGSTIQRLPVSS